MYADNPGAAFIVAIIICFCFGMWHYTPEKEEPKK